MGPSGLVALALVLWSLVGLALGLSKEVAVRDCAAGSYLDSTNFQCTLCSAPPNQAYTAGNSSTRVADGSSLYFPFPSRPSYSVPVGCTCAAGWMKASADLNTSAPCNTPSALNSAWCDTFNCVQCPAGAASTLDRTACLPCGQEALTTPPTVAPPTLSPLAVTQFPTVPAGWTSAPTIAPTTGAPSTAAPTALANTIYFDVSRGTCACSSPGQALRERGAFGQLLPSKVCEACPPGSILTRDYKKARMLDGTLSASSVISEADSYTCLRCPHPAMSVVNNNCVCSLPGDNSPLWTQVGVPGVGGGVTCILTAESLVVNQPSLAQISYTHVTSTGASSANALTTMSGGSGGSSAGRRMLRVARELAAGGSGSYSSALVKSSVSLQHFYPVQGSRCRYLRSAQDLAACQSLANLCALQQYDTATPACSLLLTQVSQKRPSWSAIGFNNWRQMTPWVQYEEQPASVLSDLGIQTQFSFNMRRKPGTYDFVALVLARYALDGTFKGFLNVTSEFEWCSVTVNTVPKWVKFGFGYRRAYACNLFNVLKYFPEPEFYDAYLVDYANGGALYPVPVRNRNLKQNGAYPNDNDSVQQEANDVLTRRFFMYDQVSAKSAVSGEPAVVRFAKSVSLTFSAQDMAANKIYPPVLEVLYQEVLVSDFFAAGVDELGNPPRSATNVEVSFTVSYTQDYTGFWRTASALFATAMTGVALLSLLRLYNWTRRNSRLPGEGQLDLVFLLRALSYMMSTFSSVFFWFLFCYAAYFFVFFKLQDNVQLLLPQDKQLYGTQNDYFPFVVTLQVCFFGQVFRMLEIIAAQTNVDVFFLDWEKPRGRISSKRGDGTKSRFTPVSVWRSLFMVNEFAEMQRCRRYDPDLAFMTLAALLVGADLQYAATPLPTLNDLEPGTPDKVLNFFLICFFFLLITYGEVFWRWLVQDRYFTEPPTRSFVDLCTMAKTSVFILDEEYHGYYLHCRSQHEHADVSMLEISKQLQQEQQGLTTDRGLPGCPQKKLQCFEIYVTGEWKRQYNVIFRSMMQVEQASGAPGDRSFLNKLLGKGRKPSSEGLVKASKRLNAFLRSFVDQDSTEFPIAHREQNFVHRFLHTPPEMVSQKESLFFPDTFYNYDSVLFYGQTWNLILFNLLCLGTFELWTGNTMLSIFLAYCVDKLFEVVRDNLGKNNLSAKTLVDDRFMI